MKMTVYSTPYMHMCMNEGRKGQEKIGQVRIGWEGQVRIGNASREWRAVRSATSRICPSKSCRRPTMRW
jgi:hypothetical protein